MTECVWEKQSESSPWVLKCRVCDYKTQPTTQIPSRYHRQCGNSEAIPTTGPGTEFLKLTDELGLNPPDGCKCHYLLREMNVLGVEGCRRDFDRLHTEISSNISEWGWADLASDCAVALWNSLVTGLAWRLNPLDPIGSLLNEAIRRAE